MSPVYLLPMSPAVHALAGLGQTDGRQVPVTTNPADTPAKPDAEPLLKNDQPPFSAATQLDRSRAFDGDDGVARNDLHVDVAGSARSIEH